MATGFLLGQGYGHGRTFQHTIVPGVGGAPVAPAAGANYTLNVGPWQMMRLVFLTFSLTTSAVAGNRYVTIEYPGLQAVSASADAATVLVGPSTNAQRFIGQYGRGTAEWNTGTDVFFPLCGIWLEVGRSITINVAGRDVADQLSGISFTFDATPIHDDGSEAIRGAEYEQRVAAAIAAGTLTAPAPA